MIKHAEEQRQRERAPAQVFRQRLHTALAIGYVIDSHRFGHEPRTPQVLFASIHADNIHAPPRHGERIKAFVASDVETFRALLAPCKMRPDCRFHHTQPGIENLGNCGRNERRGAQSAAEFERIEPGTTLFDSPLNLLARHAALQSQPSAQYVTFCNRVLVFTFHAGCRISNSGCRLRKSRAAAAG